MYQGSDQIGVSIKTPGDHSEVGSSDIEVKAEIGSTNGISKVEILVDGSVNRTVGTGNSFVETINNISKGQHTISVRATDNNGNSSQADVHIGVKEPYASPTPTPTP